MPKSHFQNTRVLLIFTLLVFCTSCSNQDQYTGDGDFKDFGSFNTNYRYVLNLGEIDFTSPKSYSFSLSGLPTNKEFTLGFSITGQTYNKPEHIGQSKPINPLIKLTLKKQSGEFVIDEKHYLNNWTWSQASNIKYSSFIYLDGKYLASNPSQLAGVLADGGWGTHFEPQKKASYKLILEIIEGEKDSDQYKVSLVAMTRGWK